MTNETLEKMQWLYEQGFEYKHAVYRNEILEHYFIGSDFNIYVKKPWHLHPQIMSPGLDKDGYKVLCFSINNKRKNVKVHRLIAENFIPNPESKPQVNHIDGDKTNNHPSNLEWATAKENTIHSFNIGLNQNTTKIAQYDYQGKLIATFVSQREAERQTGLQSSCINRCLKGLRKQHKGFTWKYI